MATPLACFTLLLGIVEVLLGVLGGRRCRVGVGRLVPHVQRENFRIKRHADLTGITASNRATGQHAYRPRAKSIEYGVLSPSVYREGNVDQIPQGQGFIYSVSGHQVGQMMPSAPSVGLPVTLVSATITE